MPDIRKVSVALTENRSSRSGLPSMPGNTPPPARLCARPSGSGNSNARRGRRRPIVFARHGPRQNRRAARYAELAELHDEAGNA